ncbi:MAG: transposase [Actinobacteria bacterium]|nr:transposase [Actinomycetota bacterium]
MPQLFRVGDTPNWVVVESAAKTERLPHVEKVLAASTCLDGRVPLYSELGEMGYTHERTAHSGKVYLSGDVQPQTIEGFWATVRSGLRGVYRSVSTEYLQSYLDEYTVRHNSREHPAGMFNAFVSRIEKYPRAGPASSQPS